ncbi:MAG: substrate-binding domain-containing protein [Candidatus Excrementavichristensenella sp.]|jgi:ribose transport system substrate-binding protein|nr:substrate-binding domain-containing protein [Bacillota bacterium]NLL54645.1 sugar ABC transporter substrate-binding protein [Clostridiales bacterium]
MKKLFVTLLAALLVLAMFAPALADEIKIVMIGQQLGNVVFLDAEKGMYQAGEDLGVTVEWQSPLRAEAELQNEIMLNLISRGDVDGIAISCTTGDALLASINAAIDSGIQVVCYDVDSPNSNREFYVGTENYKAGYTSGEYMIKLYEGLEMEEVRVAILAGIPGADDIEARIRGFEDAIADTNIRSVYTFACNDNVDEAIEGVEAYSNANGDDFDAWFMAGGWPYTVDVSAMPNTNAWKLADPNRKIVTVDIFPETTPAFFDEGVLDVAIGQSFYNMGYQCVETLVKLINGETVEAPFDETIGAKFINTGVQIATLEDYKEVIAG